MALEQGQRFEAGRPRGGRWPRWAGPTAGVALVAVLSAGVFAFANSDEGTDAWPGGSFSVLPRAEAEANESEASGTAAHQRNAEFLERFRASGRDARDLPRAELMYSYDIPPAETLGEALGRARAIVLGRVTTIDYAASDGFTETRATVQVDDTWLGEVPAHFVESFSGGPSLVGDQEILGHEPAVPSLFENDRVVLLLNPAEGEHWSVVPWDVYFVTDEGIAPGIEHTPVAKAVAGMPLAEFQGRISGRSHKASVPLNGYRRPVASMAELREGREAVLVTVVRELETDWPDTGGAQTIVSSQFLLRVERVFGGGTLEPGAEVVFRTPGGWVTGEAIPATGGSLKPADGEKLVLLEYIEWPLPRVGTQELMFLASADDGAGGLAYGAPPEGRYRLAGDTFATIFQGAPPSSVFLAPDITDRIVGKTPDAVAQELAAP